MTESVPSRDNAEDGALNPDLQGSDQSCITNGSVPNSDGSDSILGGVPHLSRDRDSLKHPQTTVKRGDPDEPQTLARRRAELELKRAELALEQDIEARRHQRRFDAIAQLITGLTNLVILMAGVYLTATGKDIGAFMMGIGGAGGAVTGIQAGRRQGGESNTR